MKKLFSTIIVFLMAFALMMPAGASEKVDTKNNPVIDSSKTSGSITISKRGSTFSIYKILDANYKQGQTNVYNYTVNNAFTGLIGENGKYSIDDIAKMPNQLNIKIFDNDGNLSSIEDPITEATSNFTTDVQAFINTNDINPAATIACADAEGASATASGLELGLYIIVETGTTASSASVASKSMLVPLPYVDKDDSGDAKWNFDLVIEPKDEPVTLDKNIRKQNGEEFELVNTSTNNIGDVLEYQVDTAIPHYDASTLLSSIKYTITDTLSAGLDFTRQDDLKIVVADFAGNERTLVKDTDYTVSYSADGKTMTINFVYPNIMAYNTLQLNYYAVINENAVIGGGENPNEVTLEYTNNPSTGQTSKPWDETKTYTYGLQILKYDAENGNTKLAGAAFELQDEAGNVIAAYEYDENGVVSGDGLVETDENGLAYFVGLEAGTYYLEETKAPEGYQILDGRAKLEIDADLETGDVEYRLNGTVIAETTAIENGGSISKVVVTRFANTKGFNLPKTGGAGTWMFTVGGILIMASMITVFVKLRKKKIN